jgi:hypothetical protein
MALTHRGAFDESAAGDILITLGSTVSALATAGPIVFPANAITGTDDVFLLTTAATPGTMTTRTASQMYADIQSLLGIQNINGFSFTLRITNTVITNTLTLAAGTGVTFVAPGTYTVGPTAFRDFVVTVVNSAAINIQTTGTGTWS